MIKAILVFIGYVLVAAPLGTAQAVNTNFINFADKGLNASYNQAGAARLSINPATPNTAHILPVAGFKKMSMYIYTKNAKSIEIYMGKISGSTLSQKIFAGPPANKIHTFDVIGPEISIGLLGGPPNSTEHVKVWIYLSE